MDLRVAEHQPVAALTLTGVLATILQPLADAEIAVLTISTFDTDWMLVPVGDAERAVEAWRTAGHEVVIAIPVRPERTPADKGAGKSGTKPRESNDR